MSVQTWQSLHELLGKRFGAMEIADQEIEKVIPREKGKKPPPDNSRAFRCAFPTVLLTDKPESVYRGHVREVAERAKSGATKDEMNAPTWAEILCALSSTSLKAPLESTHAEIMEWAFFQVYGEAETVKRLERVPKEPADSYRKEVLANVRRAIRKLTTRES